MSGFSVLDLYEGLDERQLEAANKLAPEMLRLTRDIVTGGEVADKLTSDEIAARLKLVGAEAMRNEMARIQAEAKAKAEVPKNPVVVSSTNNVNGQPQKRTAIAGGKKDDTRI